MSTRRCARSRWPSATTSVSSCAPASATYTGARLELLGPRFYLVWKRLTLQLLTWVPALVGAVVAGALVLEGDSSVEEVVADALGAAATTALQIAFWTTLTFVILDRTVTDDSDVSTPWSLERLPQVTSRDYPFSDAAMGVGWNLVVAAVLVLQHFRSWLPGPDGQDVPVLDPGLWDLWLPVLLGSIAVAIGVELWKYAAGWHLGTVLATVVSSVAASGVIWLAAQDLLLSREFVAAVDLSGGWLDRVNLAVAAGAALVALYEIGEAVVRWRHSRRTRTV